jgi:hypothetical protein
VASQPVLHRFGLAVWSLSHRPAHRQLAPLDGRAQPNSGWTHPQRHKPGDQQLPVGALAPADRAGRPSPAAPPAAAATSGAGGSGAPLVAPNPWTAPARAPRPRDRRWSRDVGQLALLQAEPELAPDGCRSNEYGSIARPGSCNAVRGAAALPGVTCRGRGRCPPSASAVSAWDSRGVRNEDRRVPRRPNVDACTVAPPQLGAGRRASLGCAGPSRSPPHLRLSAVCRTARPAVSTVPAARSRGVRPYCPPSGRSVPTAAQD